MSVEKKVGSDNITWSQIDKYLYLGTILVGVFLYISSIKTDVEVMKNDINNMKDMIKELHNQHIKENGPLGSFYDANNVLKKNSFISVNNNNISDKIPPIKDDNNKPVSKFLWVDNRKKLVDDTNYDNFFINKKPLQS
jgi:hypothetical protein